VSTKETPCSGKEILKPRILHNTSRDHVIEKDELISSEGCLKDVIEEHEGFKLSNELIN
jgi:hypothetical protein